LCQNAAGLSFRKLERDLDRLSAQPEAKRVHRFRTGVRRLQTLLEELCPARDRNQKKIGEAPHPYSKEKPGKCVISMCNSRPSGA